MVEDCIVRGLISQDCGGLWNTVRRLVETDMSLMNISNIASGLT